MKPTNILGFAFFLIVAVAAAVIIGNLDDNLVGLAAGARGCCTDFCYQTYNQFCSADFFPDQGCYTLDQCGLGCCIDNNGYCHNNFLKSRCDAQDASFFKKDCTTIQQCINPSSVSEEMQWTGISLDYDPSTGEWIKHNTERRQQLLNSPDPWSFAEVEPFAGNKDTEFRISLTSKEEFQDVTASIRYNGTELDSVQLQRDGNVYSAPWKSDLDFKGIRTFDVEIMADNSNIASADFSISQNTEALPIIRPASGASANIIILTNKYTDLDQIQQVIFNFYSGVSPFITANMNYIGIYKAFDFQSDTDAKENIEEQYPMTGDDFAIILSEEEQNCRHIIDRIYAAHPSTYFVSNADSSELLANPCMFAITHEQLDDLASNTIPYAELYLDEISQNKLKFLLKDDQDEQLNYLAVIGDKEFTGTAPVEEIQAIDINMTPGNYSAFVIAVDSMGLRYATETVEITVD